MAKYIFNGTEFPPLPEYGWAFQAIDIGDEYGVRFTVSWGKLVYDGTQINANYGSTHRYKRYKLVDNVWVYEGQTNNSNTNIIDGRLLWTNHDVLNIDGSVYFAGSDPEIILTDYVLMPVTDYKAACDAIRAKSGRKVLIPSGRMASEIKDYIDVDPPLQETEVYANGVVRPSSDYYYGLKYVRVSTAFPGTVDRSIEFLECDHLEGVTKIGIFAFAKCTDLLEVYIHKDVDVIDERAFWWCENLEAVEFDADSLPSLISASAFQNCDNIADIYVPWSEGEVANAPWGAENATIVYNW